MGRPASVSGKINGQRWPLLVMKVSASHPELHIQGKSLALDVPYLCWQTRCSRNATPLYEIASLKACPPWHPARMLGLGKVKLKHSLFHHLDMETGLDLSQSVIVGDRRVVMQMGVG